MGANASVATSEILDGASNTFMILELRAGITAYDCRGIWAMSGAGPSSVWAHGYIGDAYGINSIFPNADDTANCDQLTTAMGAAQLVRMRMTCYSGTSTSPNRQAGARSLHVDGILAAFCDGSVHWIGNHIETSGSPNYASAWDRLNLSCDGESIPDNAY